MVVEDQQFSAEIIEKFLMESSIEVVNRAKNGLEAVEYYENCLRNDQPTPDIITMDIEMPVMDGKTAASKIRELETWHNIEPAVLYMVTGNTVLKDIEDCMDKTGMIRA